MINQLKSICDKLGVLYPDLELLQEDNLCGQGQYLIDCISNFLS